MILERRAGREVPKAVRGEQLCRVAYDGSAAGSHSSEIAATRTEAATRRASGKLIEP